MRERNAAPLALQRRRIQTLPYRTTTRYFGLVAYDDNSVLRFPRGIPGFEAEREFLVIGEPSQYPLTYLQSVRQPDLCFLALPVLAVDGSYQVSLSEADAALLSVPPAPKIGDDVLCLALVSAHADMPTANLLAPIVANLHTHVAAQCIHPDGGYSTRHPLQTAVESAA